MKGKSKSFLDIIREKLSQRKGEKVMKFDEIFEKTKYAFENDEVYELLTGKKGYSYQNNFVSASVPTMFNYVFEDGIFPYFKRATPLEQRRIIASLSSTFSKLIDSTDEVEVWWAFMILKSQKNAEERSLLSPFKIADLFWSSLHFSIIKNKEKLSLNRTYFGSDYSNGLYGDVERINQILLEDFGIDVINGSCNKFYDIVKQAYESDELLLLLSADEKYTNGNEWLKPDSRLSMGVDEDLISERTLFGELVNLYRETEDINVKRAFKTAFRQMLIGTAEQIYFAAELFYVLAGASLEFKYYPFKDVYEELAPVFANFVSENSEKLKTIKVYNCKDDDNGLYEWCEYYSNKISQRKGELF